MGCVAVKPSYRTLTGLICLAVAASSALAQTAQPGSTVTVSGRQVMLADLTGETAGDELRALFASVVIAPAPRFDERRTITREQVLNAVHRRLGFAYDSRINLPPVMTVERSGGISRDAELLQTAQAALTTRWSAQCRDELTLTPRSDTALPLLPSGDDVRLAVRGVSGGRISARTQVWVDVFEQNALYRSVPLWFSTTCRTPVAVAARTLLLGTVLTDGDVSWQSMDIAALPAKALPNAQALINHETSRALAAGSVMTSADIRAVPLVRRQGPVTLLLNQETMQISIPGIAQSDAGQGETIWARSTLGDGKPLRARVIGAGRLEVVE